MQELSLKSGGGRISDVGVISVEYGNITWKVRMTFIVIDAFNLDNGI